MTAYEAALEAHTEAQAAYKIALVAFRAGGPIAAFVAASASMKIANDAFDVAYEIAANLPEEAEVVEATTQIELFAAL